ELGLAQWPRVVRRGLSAAEKRTHVRRLNLARRHLDGQQKRELIRQQWRETPEAPIDAVAQNLGVSWATARSVQDELCAMSQIERSPKVTRANGRSYPTSLTPSLAPLIGRLAAAIDPGELAFARTCTCPRNHLNCLSPKEWLKCQIGVWRFAYSRRDIRDQALHPAVFPISLATRVIALFTHQGELVVDPFAGSGTTLVAARDLHRNAYGVELQPRYVRLAMQRLAQTAEALGCRQLAVCADARKMAPSLKEGTVSLILTSPPYANLLGHGPVNLSALCCSLDVSP
ncbi:MAG TPA: site-specific DNA-methyltransferase, partial [Terriglobales bacterium]